MPPIRAVDLSDGVKITRTNGNVVHVTQSQIEAFPGNPTNKLRKAQEWLEKQFESTFYCDPSDPDNDRFYEQPPNLRPNERMDGNNVIVTEMYVKLILVSESPLRVNVTCSREPIP